MFSRFTLAFLLLASWIFTASAAESIERNPVWRSVAPHWTDLGRSDVPFKSLYVDSIVMGGTNLSGGGGSGAAITFTNTVTLAPGASAYCVNYGSTPNVFQLGLPTGLQGGNGAPGAPGTNFVQVFSNSVLSSQQFTIFASNYWTFASSNYVGRFTNGWTSISFNGGQAGGGGLSFPTNVFEQIWASTNGTSGWFVLTNFNNVTNTYSLAVVGAGGGLGSIVIQTIDHPENIGRTNGFYGQFTQFSDPLEPQDAATKNYVDLTEQNMVAGQWQNTTDTNGYFHQIVSHFGGTAFDIGFPTVTLYNSLSLDGTGTNLLLAIPQTNLPSAFVISSSTNLSLLNGWTTYTNYTISTNAGVVTFTIPIYPTQPEMFFWPRTAAIPTANLYAPLTIGNAFSLWVQTNTPTISDLGNQKGGRMWCSNGFFYLTGSTNGTTTYTKQMGP